MSMPGAISISSRPVGRQAEHAALGDVEHRLPALDGVVAAEGAVLDLVDELARRRLRSTIAQRPSSTVDLAAARR